VRIRFKFHLRASDHERRGVLDDLDAQPLFPDDDDPELASLYVADISERRLAELKRSAAVEFAEPEPDRRLSDH
jgi:hypothetical protein